MVINFSFPLTTEDYVHRIGRTGRAGKTGAAAVPAGALLRSAAAFDCNKFAPTVSLDHSMPTYYMRQEAWCSIGARIQICLPSC